MGLFSGSGKSRANDPGRYRALGAQISCPQCRNQYFYERRAQLNTALFSLVNLDWANKSATNLICSQCSYISWFFEVPARIDDA